MAFFQQLTRILPFGLQKTVFQAAKDGISGCDMRPFSEQYAAFCCLLEKIRPYIQA